MSSLLYGTMHSEAYVRENGSFNAGFEIVIPSQTDVSALKHKNRQ